MYEHHVALLRSEAPQSARVAAEGVAAEAAGHYLEAARANVKVSELEAELASRSTKPESRPSPPSGLPIDATTTHAIVAAVVAAVKPALGSDPSDRPGKASSSSPPPLPEAPKADAAPSAKPTKAKVKEADHVKLSPLPTATEFPAWRSSVRKEVAAASGTGEEAFRWIMEVESPDATFELLADCGSFPSLDTKLGSAIA